MMTIVPFMEHWNRMFGNARFRFIVSPQY